MGSLQPLLNAVRQACSPAVWSRGVELSRAGAVLGQHRTADEIEVRVMVEGVGKTPTVVLYPGDREWQCDCNARDDACVHVAAAVIAVHRAALDGKALPEPDMPIAKMSYRFSRSADGLWLERVLVDKSGERPVTLPLVTLAQQKDVRFVASAIDMTLELLLLGSPGRRLLSRQNLHKILVTLVDCPDVQLDRKPITVGDPQPVMRARLEQRGAGPYLTLIQDPGIKEIFANGAVLARGALRPVGEVNLSAAEVESLRRGVFYGPADMARLVTDVLPHLRRHVPVDVDDAVLLPDVARLPARLVLETERDGDALQVLPLLVYGDPPCARVDVDTLTHLHGPVPIRDTAAETKLRQQLERELGMQPGIKLTAHGAAAVELAERVRGFAGGSISGKGHAGFFMARPLQPHVVVQAHGEMGMDIHWDVDFVSATNATEAAQAGPARRASTAAVLQAWQAGEHLVPLLEGGWAPLPAAWLAQHGHRLLDLLAARPDDKAPLPPAALPDLARFCDALHLDKPAPLAALQAQLADFSGIPAAVLPDDLTADLRSYQRRGVDWLMFLQRLPMGAMLADDMGLGKTLQALCIIRGRTLVVAPTSVLGNWAAEAARFRPALRVCLYHGSNRQLDTTAHITLTSYALLRLDAAVLTASSWDTVILDEAQTIKNPQSQVAQAAYQLRATFRVTLTGTPVENRLDELWSQFHFLNPGLLGNREDFQERYARPIANATPGAAARLHERIRPFILRRLKRDVAPELPPRTDVVLRCTLDPDERAVYDTIRAATMAEVVERLQQGGNVLAALEALLRLRQACCHSGLIPGQHAETSAKVNLLLDTLDEVVAEGHKALVFSQWTGLLDRIEPHLRRAGIAFTRLDGSTPDRTAVVQRFQASDGPPVMLISLKAGGTGLNLTAADHVFLIDPWWNPAVEDQAADRAHRIGQQRPVLVHRLVAEDTVEERILALQAEKRAIAEAALQGTDQGSALTRDDLLALLQ